MSCPVFSDLCRHSSISGEYLDNSTHIVSKSASRTSYGNRKNSSTSSGSSWDESKSNESDVSSSYSSSVLAQSVEAQIDEKEESVEGEKLEEDLKDELL